MEPCNNSTSSGTEVVRISDSWLIGEENHWLPLWLPEQRVWEVCLGWMGNEENPIGFPTNTPWKSTDPDWPWERNLYTINSYSSLLVKVHYANHIVTSMPSHFFQPLSHTSPLLFNSNHNVPAQKNSTDRHHNTSQQRIEKSHPYAKGRQLPPHARNWTRFRV